MTDTQRKQQNSTEDWTVEWQRGGPRTENTHRAHSLFELYCRKKLHLASLNTATDNSSFKLL